MNRLERHLLNTAIGGVEPRLLLQSNTRVDTGRWLRRSRLWLCITDTDVVVLAASRRQYIQVYPIHDCQDSHFCHSTGELVITANEEREFNRLAMDPTDALDALGALTFNTTTESEK